MSESMDAADGLLILARRIARQLAIQGVEAPSTMPLSDASRLDKSSLTEAQPIVTISALCEEALSCLDRAPREAWSFARVAYELAHMVDNAPAGAEAALTLAITLNRLGEFGEALPLCRKATTLSTEAGEKEKTARGLCEAAWAETFIGRLNDALADLQRVRESHPSPLLQARCDWIQGRICRDQGRYPEGEALFQKACDAFEAASLPLDVARCERELARTYLLYDRDPLALLEKARSTFESNQCRLDAALCDWFKAMFLLQTNQYDQAAALLLRTRQICLELGAAFFAAVCDMELGITYRHLNQFDTALESFHHARDYFLSHGIQADVAACDINLANAYYALNRYDEALTLYQDAALSLSEERLARAARIYTNMALVYSKQGFFAKSITLNQRALEIATTQDIPVLVGHCHLNLARAYRELGQHSQALRHLVDAREIFLRYQLHEYLAECEMDLAEIHLVRGERIEAVAELDRARAVSAEIGFDSFVAVCDRLLAQAVGGEGEREHSLELLAKSRALFLKHRQVVDAALCDVTEGELRFDWNEVGAARDCFHRARETLFPSFPDHAWRADYGLGRCALADQDRTAALEHYLLAVRTIDRSRSMLVTEQLSNDFFAHRQSVYEAALSLALQDGATASALELIEAGKARAFLALLQQREWKTPKAQTDPYIADLIAREKASRYQLGALRRRLTVQIEDDVPKAFRTSSEGVAISDAALQELNVASQAYEAVVTQLRLATTGLTGVSAPAPFALDSFRNAVNATLGTDWTALDYALTNGQVVIAIIDPQSLRVERVPITGYDDAVIRKCTSAQQDLQELIYRATIHGQRAQSSGSVYLRHLHRLLIPKGIDSTTLIIAPHGSLHALPFQALMGDDGYLIEKHCLAYAPSLQVMQHLLNTSVDTTEAKSLFYGIDDFNTQMQPLSNATVEIERLREIFKGRGEYLFGPEATRRRLFDLNTTQELKQFALLHFATHAVLDREAPHQSRVILSDEPLTAADVLDLTLNARLVTLSGCQTALSRGGSGDELAGLARAFFYAGARALLATLWAVEDGSIAELVERIYRHWSEKGNVAQALRLAQIEMIGAGCSPYQWAPFVLMGRP